MKNNWQAKKLGEVLEYEQPTQYIVKSTSYKDDYETPVLTAGKSFILGKTKEKSGIFPTKDLPVIIFDDFTTATKFVNFPFKVKSSAMKILHPVKNVSDAKFLFYIMQNISFDHTGIHKRYWISEYSKIKILLPPLTEQKRITKILDELIEKIEKARENAEKNIQNSKELFESYLQSVFTNPEKDWAREKLGDILQKTETINPLNEPSKEFIYVDVSSINKKTFSIENTTLVKGKDAPSRARKLIKTNDVIYATIRPTLKRIAIVPENLNEQVCSTGYFILRSKDVLINKLIFYFLQSNDFNEKMERLQKGASYPAVTDKEIKNQIILFPKSIARQKAIITKLDTLSVKTKKLESTYKQKLESLEELKKSILKRAFNGDL
ncbi:MAG: restriction endonuclease subunit S [Candidatus Paceibacterota bacterium]|jgi:type I restriction enzyme S subunit